MMDSSVQMALSIGVPTLAVLIGILVNKTICATCGAASFDE